MLLAIPVSLFAQIGGGSLVGSVTDPTGGVIAGAKVTATNLDTNERRETSTNGDG